MLSWAAEILKARLCFLFIVHPNCRERFVPGDASHRVQLCPVAETAEGEAHQRTHFT